MTARMAIVAALPAIANTNMQATSSSQLTGNRYPTAAD